MTAKLMYEVLEEEIEARGWSLTDLAFNMGGDSAVNLLSLELMSLGDNQIRLGLETATQIGNVFGTGAKFWMSLAAAQPTPDEKGAARECEASNAVEG